MPFPDVSTCFPGQQLSTITLSAATKTLTEGEGRLPKGLHPSKHFRLSGSEPSNNCNRTAHRARVLNHARLRNVKVVILAGGLGTRMREETEFRPKPMVEIGGKPVLWHIMKTFASYGYTEFVVCAGYKGDLIKNYFYNYAASNMDFTVQLGEADSAVFHGSHDEFGWSVTVADTGLKTPTGGRIHKVRKYLGDERFFCTYGDGIANINLEKLLHSHLSSKKNATMTITNPRTRFGMVQVENGNTVAGFLEKPVSADPINIGYFVFEAQIFELLTETSVLEESPLTSLAARHQLSAFHHEGFWQAMDTYREYQMLNDLWEQGEAAWRVWD